MDGERYEDTTYLGCETSATNTTERGGLRVALHGRLWREQANRRQPTDGLNQGLNGVEQPTEGDLFLKRATAGWLAARG